MTQQHPLDDADLVDFGDGEDFEGDLSDDFAADDKDFAADDDDFADDKDFAADDDDFAADDDDFADDQDAAADQDSTDDKDFAADEAGRDDEDAPALEDEDDDDDDDDDDVPPPADDDDDDEEVHPSDVEADLEEILRDRIAASDDDEDEEEDAAGQLNTVSVVGPPRSDEWTCNQCFLIVSMTQFGLRTEPVCPSGEEPCESIKRIFSG